MSIIYMPSDRLGEDSLRDAIEESRFLGQQAGGHCLFLPEIYAAAAGDATGDVATRLQAVAAAGADASEAVTDDIRKSVADFAFLIRAWPQLVANAATITPSLERLISVP